MFFVLYFFVVYPVKDGLSTDVRSESFDDEAFETGNKNQFLMLTTFTNYTYTYWFAKYFIQSVIAVLDTGV